MLCTKKKTESLMVLSVLKYSSSCHVLLRHLFDPIHVTTLYAYSLCL